MCDYQAGIHGQGEKRPSTDLREPDILGIRELTRKALPIEKRHGLIGAKEFGGTLTRSDELPDTFHPHSRMEAIQPLHCQEHNVVVTNIYRRTQEV
jgi:hypothetical protein